MEISWDEASAGERVYPDYGSEAGWCHRAAALQVNRGEKVKRTMETGSEVIAKENMYSNENQKLLFPFVGK